MAQCEYCRKPFQQGRRNQRYCTSNCVKRASEQRNRAKCQRCGAVLGVGSAWHDIAHCRSCRYELQAERRQRRREVIARRWNEDAGTWAIATELDTTSNSIRVEINRMRADGWDLPRRTTKVRPKPTEERGERDQRDLVKRRWRMRIAKQVHDAVVDGTLIRPDACSRCDATDHIEGHHADYSKPLEVEWLCFDCHQAEHHPVAKVA